MHIIKVKDFCALGKKEKLAYRIGENTCKSCIL